MPQIREQIAMVHLPPSKTLKYLFHVRKTRKNLVHKNEVFSVIFACGELYCFAVIFGIRRVIFALQASGRI